jgi:hypothetical protein
MHVAMLDFCFKTTEWSQGLQIWVITLDNATTELPIVFKDS